jgi:hypothetical protein
VTTKVKILTSGSSWTVPADVTSVTAHCVGGGGGGAAKTATNNTGSAGGRGGHYARKTLTVTPSASISYSIGSGGPTNTAGGDTWFSSS